MKLTLPDLAYLRQRVTYDPLIGVFYWVRRVGKTPQDRSWNSSWANKEAGHRMVNGYIIINFTGKYILAHRLAWLFTTGAWPSGDIDHADGDRANNRIDNLRIATRSQNLANAKCRKSKTRMKGVHLVPMATEKTTRPYRAQITIAGKARHLGCFATPEEAHAAYLQHARAVYGAFARSG